MTFAMALHYTPSGEWSIEGAREYCWPAVVRKRFTFRGTVQGVGFRPAVYRLAVSLGLAGFVQNRRSEVVAEVQGDENKVARFKEGLRSALPAAARLESASETDAAVRSGESPFRIIESGTDAYSFPPIPPDLPTCSECSHELLDPANRRYLFPFITCTQCGPRYSIVERTPFDRENTSMKPFEQCAACSSEYRDPSDRRFHSQTNSCAGCGPKISAFDSEGRQVPGDPVRAAIRAISGGMVVAIQGIGGFHLAADPRAEAAVTRLRRDKERERKPFALMVRDLEEARTLCRLSEAEERLLTSSEAPIVIASRRAEAPAWSERVSDTDTLGMMLPYTPLHLLLFVHPESGISWQSLIMTSGNRAGEPIITDPGEARDRLADAADLFLCHDRRIVFRTDDSIVRAGRASTGPASAPFLLRRSRGYVPRLLHLPREVGGIVLALGGDLKNAPALARGTDLHLSAFNGDLESAESLEQFDRQVRQLLELYEVSPDLVAQDLHPGYYSSQWRGPGARRVSVQHHHAHALSVMAEHGLEEALALCFDGTGYGTDGTIWGGEFLHATRAGFTRLGSFAPFALPGGDAAVLNPPRIALAALGDEGKGRIPGLDAGQEKFLRAMISGGVNSPLTSSLGRLFDAAAAILGLVERTTYEGEGPIRLEGRGLRAKSALERDDRSPHRPADLIPLLPGPGDQRLFLADARPLLASLLTERPRDPSDRAIDALALRFHEAVASASREGARRMRAHTGVSRIALSGGVFQNLLLRDILIPLLVDDGFEVFLNELAPAGDGGLAVGQAWFEER
jgi:hydrogenase maturation protein HypF